MAVWHRHWAGRGGWGPVHRWHSTSSGLSGIPSVTLGSDLTALSPSHPICRTDTRIVAPLGSVMGIKSTDTWKDCSTGLCLLRTI